MELDASALQNITSSTGGEYYAAANVTELRQRFEQIARELGGQYVFRWTTLKRTSASFTPEFTITHGDASGSYTGSRYRPTDYAGDPLHGFLRISSDVYLRASYVPRYIRELRLYVLSPFDFTPVPTGLCSGWSVEVEPPDAAGGVWFTVSSPNPDDRNTSITYGAFGSLVRFDFYNAPHGVTEFFQQVAIDNTIYETTGGQSFELVGWVPPPPPRVRVVPMAVNLTDAVPSATVTVENDGGFALCWTADWTDPGIQVAPASATGNRTEVTVTATDLSQRVAEVTFVNDDDSQDTALLRIGVNSPVFAGEDFESGGFGNLPWEHGGDAPWFVDSSQSYEGSYSARSGDIGHNQSSSLLLTVEGITRISFCCAVSSEWYWDRLRFEIDGQEMGSWSGVTGWQQAVFDVSPGEHSLAWLYAKDGSVSTGADCAWIDNVTFEQ